MITRHPRILTHAPHGHILANAGVWSPDSQWLVYDVRSDPAGSVFDGTRIEKVNVHTGEVRVLYESRKSACCGIPTYHPRLNQIVFTLGPEHPTPDWQYSACHRRGMLLDETTGIATPLDARDMLPPFTPGALRGGSHLHTFSPDGRYVAFTYEDAVLEQARHAGVRLEANQRNVGVSIVGQAVDVPSGHPRNHSGSAYSVLVTETTDRPAPGSDQISRACEEAWIGVEGYLRPDGSRQAHALAFQGTVTAMDGRQVIEAFIVDLSEDLTQPGSAPLAGTATTRPRPPRGVRQRRLTFTADRRYPGLQGPRHWLRSSPDGSQIAFLMRDDAGVVQIFVVSPNGGEPQQVTHGEDSVASAFSWSRDGAIVFIAGGRVCACDVRTARLRSLCDGAQSQSLRPESCVVSGDSRWVAHARSIVVGAGTRNQIAVVPCAEK